MNLDSLKHEVLTSSELVGLFRAKLSRTFEKWGVSFAYLAGSWARGQNGWWSDVDIFVSIPTYRGASEEEKSLMYEGINRDSWRETNLDDLHVTIFEKCPIHVQYRAILEGILLFERDAPERIGFIEDLAIKYPDFMIWFKGYLKQALGVFNRRR
ncbi:MAG: nucleotidyltransferase domain-containing protein [Promethearchaeota archaeon]